MPIDAMVIKGGIDASRNPNFPAANAGDTYRITVAGKIGGASGPNIEVGDMIICFVDATSAGTYAAVGANWIIEQTNQEQQGLFRIRTLSSFEHSMRADSAEGMRGGSLDPINRWVSA